MVRDFEFRATPTTVYVVLSWRMVSPDGILTRKQMRGHGLVDDGRRRAVDLRGEVPPAQQRNSHGLEISGAHGVDDGNDVLCGPALCGLYVEVVHGRADAQRHHPDKTHRANTRQRRHALAQLREELHRLVVRVILDFRVHRHDQQVAGLESDVDGGGIAEAAQKEPGGGQAARGRAPPAPPPAYCACANVRRVRRRQGHL